jgi:hypothetical protein
MKSFANTKLDTAWGGLLVLGGIGKVELLGKGIIWVRWLAIQTA